MKDELGYKHVCAWPIDSKEKGGKISYHMIHASDRDEAPKVMNRAYRHAVSQRESLKKHQSDLGALWGDTGNGEKPVRQ
jgi:hypothetical protein